MQARLLCAITGSSSYQQFSVTISSVLAHDFDTADELESSRPQRRPIVLKVVAFINTRPSAIETPGLTHIMPQLYELHPEGDLLTPRRIHSSRY